MKLIAKCRRKFQLLESQRYFIVSSDSLFSFIIMSINFVLKEVKYEGPGLKYRLPGIGSIGFVYRRDISAYWYLINKTQAVESSKEFQATVFILRRDR